MANYSSHYHPYGHDDSRSSHHPSTYAASPVHPTTLASPNSSTHPALQQVPFYNAPQQSLSYSLPSQYIPVTQPYTAAGYHHAVVSSSPHAAYTYYPDSLPSYSAVPPPPPPPHHTASYATYDSPMQQQISPHPSPQFLAPNEAASVDRKVTRAASLASNTSPNRLPVYNTTSRSTSPSTGEVDPYGYVNGQGSYSCAYPGCTSRSTFNRGCDLRKHYRRHTKTLFCRVAGCPQSTEGGFSSKKDRARHEAKHNPSIQCEWDGCDRVFSRVDNMKDHVRRIHKKEQAKTHAAQPASHDHLTSPSLKSDY